MSDDRIQQLNKLNHQFYSDSAVSFSQTRTSQWEGWSRALPVVKALFQNSQGLRQTPRVLDIGCGNGRFLDFLQNHAKLQGFSYHGVDLSDTLLKDAAAISIDQSVDRKLTSMDLVEALIHKPEKLFSSRYDLVVAFGVMHHLPSFKLRQQLLEAAWRALEPNGIFLITFWKFANGTRFLNRTSSPLPAEDDLDQFSEHDHLLPWQEKSAARYAHHFCSEEINELLQIFPSESVVDQFSADGKEQLNHYIILKKLT